MMKVFLALSLLVIFDGLASAAVIPVENDTVIRIGHPAAFGIGSGFSANYVLSLSLNITYTMWMENVNQRGGINILGRNYMIELVVVDVGDKNATKEAEKNKKVTTDMVAGVYGRIDFFFPAYSGARTLESLEITDKNQTLLITSTGDGGVLRCQAPLPKNCKKVGDIRFPNWGGVIVQTPGQSYFNGFIGMVKLEGAKTLVTVTENVSFTLGVIQGAVAQANTLKFDILEEIVIARHQVNTLTTAEVNYTSSQKTQMTQLKAAVTKIKEHDPDAVVVGSYQDLCRNLMNEFYNQNYLPKAIGFVQCLGQQLVDEYDRSGSHGLFIMGASGFAPGLRGQEYTEDATDPMYHWPPSSELPSSDVFANAFVDHWLFKQSNLPVQPSIDGRSWVLPTYQLGASYVQGYVVYQTLTRAQSFNKAAWRAEMFRVQFNSFYGPVAFDNAGINYAKIFITQQLYPDNYFYTVAPLDQANAQMIYPAPSWDDRSANYDLTDVDKVFIALGICGSILCIALLVLFIIWRDKPQIVASSLVFCLIILAGAAIAFASLALWTTHIEDWICVAQPWFLVIGLDLFMAPLLIKNWRVFILFQQAAKLRVAKIPVWLLLVSVVAACVPDIIVLLVWSIGFTPRALLISPVDFFASLNFYVCSSTGQTVAESIPYSPIDMAFVATLGAIKGAYILGGMIVTFLLRKVPTEFNEAKYVGYATYNLALCILLMLIIWLALPAEQWIFSVIAHEVILLWALFVSVGFIFIPKVYFVLTGRKSNLRISSTSRSSMAGSSAVSGSDSGSGGNRGNMPSLREKELEIEIDNLKAEVARLKGEKPGKAKQNSSNSDRS